MNKWEVQVLCWREVNQHIKNKTTQELKMLYIQVLPYADYNTLPTHCSIEPLQKVIICYCVEHVHNVTSEMINFALQM